MINFDTARFGRLLSGLGLSSPQPSGKIVKLFQGKPDTIIFDGDVLHVLGADIRDVKLVSGAPKLTFQELESIMGLSERVKTAGFPPLELEMSVAGKVTGVAGKTIDHVVFPHGKSDALVGLPASSGKVKADCLILPSEQIITGKIIVLKNSKDLLLLVRQKPAGIILEEGNLLSHASIIAREAKIPAVIKVKDATSILRNGDVVELDANRGTIKKS